MAQASLARRLSAQDASFLYAERKEAPMHIGSIAIFEGEVSYTRFVDNIASKLHLIPRYLQRVVPAPFGIGHPTWEWDPEFDIKRHIISVKIDAPGTDAQLFDLAGKLFAGMLDRNKPLWEMYLVNGLQGNRSALVSKVHHSLVDGVSGIELLMVVLDVSQNPAPAPRKEREARPPIPGPLTRLIDAVFDDAHEQLDRVADLQRTIVDEATTGDPRLRAMLNAAEVSNQYFATPMERAPFNKPLAGGRKIACSEFSFQEIRSIRQACGGTVNDVVLAVLGGALGRYLEMHGQKLPEDRVMRILTPVNVRRDDERGALGNRVSMLLVEVPVGLRDPIERLNAISQRTDRLKKRRVAEGIELFGDLLAAVPPALQALAGMLPPPPNTLGHMVCTNVPGPMIPLYTVGHRLLVHYPLIPIAWEMGIGCGVTSYDQKIYFGLMGDSEAGADVGRLKEFLDQSYVELRSAAGVARSEIPDLGVAAAATGKRKRRGAEVPARMAADSA